MTQKLENFIQDILPLPSKVLAELVLEMKHLEYPKNFILLKPGATCKYLWFMTQGLVRYYYTSDHGKEHNTWFSIDLQIVTDPTSFVRQEPTPQCIQLLEDAELFAIDNNAIQKLLQKHHIFALWYIKLAEKHYITQIDDRAADLQFLDAKQRYQKLLQLHPDITNRISLGHIASYLNITQETLSRIRANY